MKAHFKVNTPLFSPVLKQHIMTIEQKMLNMLLPQYFGYHLAQYTYPDWQYDLAASTIQHRVLLTDVTHSGISATMTNQILINCHEVPLANNSVDVLVLPHLLELVEQPQLTLDEACRVVMPHGFIIIFGFNPWSLLAMTTRRQITAKWLTVPRLRRWLAYQSFETVYQNQAFYRTAMAAETSLKQNGLWEKIAHRTCRPFGGVYCIVAQKCIATLTLLKPTWQKSRATRLTVPLV